MVELNSKDRAFLRSLANRLTATVQIGKGGFTPQTATDLDSQLLVRELVKAHLTQTAPETVREAAQRAAEDCDAAVVQTVGRSFVLYRPSKRCREKGTAIVLPSAAGRKRDSGRKR